MGHDRYVRSLNVQPEDKPPENAVESESEGLLVRGLWGADSVSLEPDATSTSADAWSASDPLPGLRAPNLRGRWAPNARQIASPVPFRGRYTRAVPAAGDLRDLAWVPTLRRASARHRHARADMVISPRIEDLLRKQRVCRPGRLLLFVVDVSGSMGVTLTALAKRIALAVLQDAYVRRDRVAMIAFREKSAELLFGPTNQVSLVRRAFGTLPCGGTTPLARGLQVAHETLRRCSRLDAGWRPTLILVSDGRANVGTRPGYMAMLGEVEAATRALARMPSLSIVFLDTTEDGKNDAPAQHLAEQLHARRVVLSQVTASGADPAAVLRQLLDRGSQQ
jgi:magnesium chelatase subunit D